MKRGLDTAEQTGAHDAAAAVVDEYLRAAKAPHELAGVQLGILAEVEECGGIERKVIHGMSSLS